MQFNNQIEQLLLNLPGYVFWKNKDFIFLGSNHTFANALKFKHGLDIAGLTDHTLPCELSNSADHFISQDEQAMGGTKVVTLNIHTYADDKRRILLTEKSRLYDQNKTMIGTIGNSIELNSGLVFNIANLLCKVDDKLFSIASTCGSYLVSQETYHHTLSARESQCLFYLIRGKTAKEIAAYLQLSQKTIETYIHRIKIKLACQTKSQLIEKAINDRYVTIIPSGLLS